MYTRRVKSSKKLQKKLHHDIELVTRSRKHRFPSMRQFLRIGNILNKKQKIIFCIAIGIFLISTIYTLRIVSAQYQVEVPKVDGSYTEGVIGSPQLMNPLFSSLNDADQDIVALVYSGLMRYDEKRSLVPDIAVNYHLSEDNKTYTFTLKEHIRWHDGEKFTADDVVYTFETVQDPQVNSPLFVGFQGVIIEKIDDYTVAFTLAEPFPSFLSSLTVGILPEHVWAGIPNSQLRLANRNVNPIGSGPFTFKELFKDQTGYIHRVTLERFEDFYRNAPYLEEFVFEYFNDYDGPTGVISALREKRIEGVHFVPFDMREKIQRKHITLHTLQLPQYTALFFNVEESSIKDTDVRQGLMQALDREHIIREVLSQEAHIIQGPILEGFPGYNADVDGHTFSIEDANVLLDESYARVTADDYRSLIREEKLEILVQAERDRLGVVIETQTEEIEEEVEPAVRRAEVAHGSKQGETPTDVGEETAQEDSIEESTALTPEIDIDEEALGELVDEELDRELDAVQLFYRYPKGSDDKKNIFELDLVTVARPEYIKVAELVAGYWQDIGVKVHVTLVDAKDLSREILRGRDYDVLLYGVIVGNDPDQYPFWHSSQIGYPGLNLSQYANEDVDKLLIDIREATTEEDREKLYVALQQRIIEDVPAAFLYTPTYTYALSDNIKGFTTSRISRPADRFADVTSWYVDTKRVWKNPK